MDNRWVAISQEREQDWLHLASSLLQGIIFEYFPENDFMIYTQYGQDGYHSEKRMQSYFVLLKQWIHPEDMGELEHVLDKIRHHKSKFYGELRICFDSKYPNHYQMGAIRGKGIYDEKGTLIRYVGRMYLLKEQLKEKQQLYNEAKKDSMTLLWNHKYTKEYIQDYLGNEEGEGAFYIIDVDNFKKINDTMGHLFGDQVILAVSRALRSIFRTTDIVGRMGGDEFVVFMKNTANKNMIMQKCSEICANIAQVYCGEQIYKLSASIGVARYPEDGNRFEELFEKADKALYYVKGNGKNNSAIYSPHMAQMAPAERGLDHMEDSEEGREDDYGDFYNEITELTFRLMGNSTDVDSAIQLLLHKLRDYFHLDIIIVQEVVKDLPRTLECIYEVCNENDKKLLHTRKQYNEAEWLFLLNAMEKGLYRYDSMVPQRLNLFFREGRETAGLRIPLGNPKYFTAVVDFLFLDKKHRWEDKEIHFLESFAQILGVYLTKIRTLDEANFLATMMQERDSVTGLYSYTKFLERMKEAISMKPESIEFIYIYSDISHFKYINETYGYEVGDLVLRKVADYLTNGCNDNMICVSRVHSDNIVMAVKNVRNYSVEQLAEIIDTHNKKLVKRMEEYVHDRMLAICTGMFVTADKKISAEEAVSNAAYACKEGKKQEQNKCMIFTSEMMHAYKRQLHFLSELHSAIDKKELMVHIQPKMMSDGRTVAGGEALVRWKKKEHEILLPNDFIQIFEKSGAIVDVDFYVYQAVFQYLRCRLDKGLPVVPISMNVSRVHLSSDRMPEFIYGLLEEYQIDPSLIEFELTESIYVENLEKAVKLSNALRAMGSRVSIDDFGSGYSSLNMLTTMPVDGMKIDRLFLKKTDMENKDRIILECLVNMAKKLQMQVVCEGVETEAQYQFLTSIGCDIMQGFYFGKPMPMEEFDKFLEKSYRPRAMEEIGNDFGVKIFDRQ